MERSDERANPFFFKEIKHLFICKVFDGFLGLLMELCGFVFNGLFKDLFFFVHVENLFQDGKQLRLLILCFYRFFHLRPHECRLIVVDEILVFILFGKAIESFFIRSGYFSKPVLMGFQSCQLGAEKFFLNQLKRNNAANPAFLDFFLCAALLF